jgi:hypothetical protein
VVVLALAGCGAGDAGPATQPTVSVTPSATPTPTVEIPEVPVPSLPDEATEYTSDGAIAFVRYAVEVINRAYLTGDTDSIADISTDACAACLSAIEVIDGVYSRGNRLEGGQMTLVRTDWVAMGENVVPTVPAVVDISVMEEVAANNDVVATTPADVALELLWDLEWHDGAWVLVTVRKPEV